MHLAALGLEVDIVGGIRTARGIKAAFDFDGKWAPRFTYDEDAAKGRTRQDQLRY